MASRYGESSLPILSNRREGGAPCRIVAFGEDWSPLLQKRRVYFELLDTLSSKIAVT